MASATLEPPSAAAIPTVDLRLLSQSDLYTLSLSSPSSSTASTVVVPQINRSVFNESAGSRKQTYSRLRLAKINRSLPVPKPATSDPESAENARIISVLKSLFSGTPPDDVALHPPENILPTPDAKRKRGRPRRNPNSSPNPSPNPNRANVIKGIFVNGNASEKDLDRDRERVNGKGVEVDLDELARSEEPYKEELERRSVGLNTEEQFLAYLGGLSGQWGSRRKKKRVVEADGFGDSLPKGWKFLLSLKKKEGRVWMYVRRYISPNGRNFMSCKEVASYLLSIFNLKDANQPPLDQINNNVQPTQGMGHGHATDSAVKDIKDSVKMEYHSPSVVSYVPEQKQITPVIGSPHTSLMGNPGDIQSENGLKCVKCNMSFNVKDEFMHHQLSSHRRKRSKFGSSITDGVIIKDGEYECQFCHKRFVEWHRYKGHVGAHKRHHMKNDEGSPHLVVSLPGSVELESPNQDHPEESNMQASTGDDSDSVTANYRIDGQQKLASPDSALNVASDTQNLTDIHYNEVNNLPCNDQESQSITITHCSAHNSAEQNLFGNDFDRKMDSTLGSVDETNDLAAARFNTNLESTVPMSIDGTDTSDELIANKFVDREPSSDVHDNTSGDDIIMDEVSVSAVGPSQQADSEIVSLAPQQNEDMYNADITEELPSSLPFELSTFDTERSTVKVDRSHSPSPVPVVNDEGRIDTDGVHMVSPSALPESKQKRFSESDEEVMFGFKDIYTGCNSVSNPSTDIAHNSKNEIMIEHKNSVSCLNMPSQAEELGDMADHAREDIVCTMQASGKGKSSEIGNASIDVGNVAMMETERLKSYETQTYRSNEIAFGSSHQILRPAVRRPEFGIPFLSGNQHFFAEENVSGNNTVLSQPKSNQDNVFRTEYGLGNPFSDVYTMNRVTHSSTVEPKPDAVLNSGNNELMIDFGNNGSDIVANPMDNVPMEQIFFEIDRSRESRSTGEESKQESNLLDPSFNYSKPGGSENYLDRIDTASVWDGPILDGAADFGHDKLMIGFSNSGAHSHVDPMGANMWRTTDDRHTFPNTLSGSSTQHVGSSSFMNTNMISDKEDDMFLGFNGVQSAATEHHEFSFMSPHSLDSFPRDSKTIYNSSMGQGFDSSFWLEKDDLSLNIAARNLVTSICVWCRNEFRHEPDNSGTQNGAIGSICPTCSARVSQQFNVF